MESTYYRNCFIQRAKDISSKPIEINFEILQVFTNLGHLVSTSENFDLISTLSKRKI